VKTRRKLSIAKMNSPATTLAAPPLDMLDLGPMVAIHTVLDDKARNKPD
jgi:hypothetical protein